jgi:hypothetical protein
MLAVSWLKLVHEAGHRVTRRPQAVECAVKGMGGAGGVSSEVVDDEYDDCPCDDLPQHLITSPEVCREACCRE